MDLLTECGITSEEFVSYCRYSSLLGIIAKYDADGETPFRREATLLEDRLAAILASAIDFKPYPYPMVSNESGVIQTIQISREDNGPWDNGGF